MTKSPGNIEKTKIFLKMFQIKPIKAIMTTSKINDFMLLNFHLLWLTFLLN